MLTEFAPRRRRFNYEAFGVVLTLVVFWAILIWALVPHNKETYHHEPIIQVALLR